MPPTSATPYREPEAAASAPDPIESTVSTTSASGVTLVRIALRSTVAVDLQVRITNALDGPVLPPREAGVAESGWSDEAYVGTVPASGTLGVGYACPICSTETPDAAAASVEVVGPADGSAVASTTETDASATDSALVATAIRSLGRARPPADALVGGTPADDSGGGGAEPTNSMADRDHAAESPSEPTRTTPVVVEAWLDAVETRVRCAERLTDATVAEATGILDERGGVAGIEGLPGALAADEAALEALQERLSELHTRVAATNTGPVVSSLTSTAAARAGPGKEPTDGGCQ